MPSLLCLHTVHRDDSFRLLVCPSLLAPILPLMCLHKVYQHHSLRLLVSSVLLVLVLLKVRMDEADGQL